MRILILGADGYLGWPLTLHLLKKGHEVACLDSYIRRERVKDCGSNSLTPIQGPIDRRMILRNFPNYIKERAEFGLHEYPNYITTFLSEIKPDAIVHLAEQPSAPWSMIDARHSVITQWENVIGTLNLLWAMKEVCPKAHLLKLGTMGEYGTPNCDIPEGRIPRYCLDSYKEPAADGFQYECPMKGLPFPKSPGSFYHLSKVHDTNNIIFACKNWNLCSTDIMQGPVFGVKVTGDEKETELTRFDYDECFGTVINRFCTQAIIEHPLTVYGEGNQIRGYLPLKDSIQCMTIALENPPEIGEYRTLNQFENTYTINELAYNVARAAKELDLNVGISHIKNPRKEKEEHYYNPAHQKLFDLGYKSSRNTYEFIRNLIRDILPYKDRIIKDVIMPTVNWR